MKCNGRAVKYGHVAGIRFLCVEVALLILLLYKSTFFVSQQMKNGFPLGEMYEGMFRTKHMLSNCCSYLVNLICGQWTWWKVTNKEFPSYVLSTNRHFSVSKVLINLHDIPTSWVLPSLQRGITEARKRTCWIQDSKSVVEGIESRILGFWAFLRLVGM